MSPGFPELHQFGVLNDAVEPLVAAEDEAVLLSLARREPREGARDGDELAGQGPGERIVDGGDTACMPAAVADERLAGGRPDTQGAASDPVGGAQLQGPDVRHQDGSPCRPQRGPRHQVSGLHGERLTVKGEPGTIRGGGQRREDDVAWRASPHDLSGPWHRSPSLFLAERAVAIIAGGGGPCSVKTDRATWPGQRVVFCWAATPLGQGPGPATWLVRSPPGPAPRAPPCWRGRRLPGRPG